MKYISHYYDYISPKEKASGKGLKLLSPKKMLQRLAIALAQVQ